MGCQRTSGLTKPKCKLILGRDSPYNTVLIHYPYTIRTSSIHYLYTIYTLSRLNTLRLKVCE